MEAEQQHHLGNIHESIDRANRLTEQLLTLARLDPMQAARCAADRLAAQRASDVAKRQPASARKTGAAQARMRMRFRQVFPPLGNEVLLQLMLRNLLDNAIRYSPPNSHVTLTLDANGLSVCDEGPGIAAEHLPRIRERFYRPPGQSQQGSGLGLSIVQRIADFGTACGWI